MEAQKKEANVETGTKEAATAVQVQMATGATAVREEAMAAHKVEVEAEVEVETGNKAVAVQEVAHQAITGMEETSRRRSLPHHNPHHLPPHLRHHHPHHHHPRRPLVIPLLSAVRG